MKQGLAMVAGVGFVAALNAQTTWIVDPNGGGNFTDLGAAIAAASHDDTLLIRGGVYPPQIVNKQLHFVGDGPGPTRIDRLHLQPLGPAGIASFRDLVVIELRCDHDSIVENVQAAHVLVSQSATVSLRGCGLGAGTPFSAIQTSPALMIMDANVALNSCTVNGNRSAPWGSHCLTGGCVTMNDGRLAITDSTLTGSPGGPASGCASALPGYALSVWSGTVRLTRSTVTGGSGSGTQSAAVFLDTPATLYRDASVVVSPSATPGTLEPYPGTTANSAPPGAAITATVHGEPSGPAALIAGLGLRAPQPTPLGEAWIDPASYVVLRIGFGDAMGDLAATITLPAAAPMNLPITFQGLTLPATSTDLVLGAPVVVQVL